MGGACHSSTGAVNPEARPSSLIRQRIKPMQVGRQLGSTKSLIICPNPPTQYQVLNGQESSLSDSDDLVSSLKSEPALDYIYELDEITYRVPFLLSPTKSSLLLRRQMAKKEKERIGL